MQCSLFSDDGALMSEGTCNPTEHGIEMTAQRWHLSPKKGDGPLMLMVEEGRQYQVRVDDIHVTANETGTDPTEVYHLTVLDTEGTGTEEKRGFLQSIFGRRSEG